MARCKVVVRVRPPALTPASGALDWDDQHIYLPSLSTEYEFDHVLDPAASQETVYALCARHFVPDFFAGINCSVLAYGQTGSGKTFTIGTEIATNKTNKGVISRALIDVFAHLEAASAEPSAWTRELHATYIELYREEIIDLLNPLPLGAPAVGRLGSGPRSNEVVSDLVNSRRSSLTDRVLGSSGGLGGSARIKISQNSETNGIQLIGVKSMPVASVGAALHLLQTGSLHRKTSCTSLNATSSRSHAILTLWLKQHNSVEGITLESKFHFVDLAGSERVKRTHATGNTLREGININSGLLALSNVINGLTSTDPSSHVPYRDSKLTRILQDSLGGNSKTVLIACISPLREDLSETCSTLKYAGRARNLENKVMVNIKKPEADVKLLRQQLATALEEVKRLNESRGSSSKVCALEAEVVSLRAQLKTMSEKIALLRQEARQISPSLAKFEDDAMGEEVVEEPAAPEEPVVVNDFGSHSAGLVDDDEGSEQLQTDCDRLDCAIKCTSELITGTVVEQGYWEQVATELGTKIQTLADMLRASEEQTLQLTQKIVELDSLSFIEEVKASESAATLQSSSAENMVNTPPADRSSKIPRAGGAFSHVNSPRYGGHMEKSVMLMKRLKKEREMATTNSDQIRKLQLELRKVSERRDEAMSHVRSHEVKLRNLHKEKEQIKAMMHEKERRINEKDRLITKLEQEAKKLKQMVAPPTRPAPAMRQGSSVLLHLERVLEDALQVKLDTLIHNDQKFVLERKRRSLELEQTSVLGKMTLLSTQLALAPNEELEMLRLQKKLDELDISLKLTQNDLAVVAKAECKADNPNLDLLLEDNRRRAGERGPAAKNANEIMLLIFNNYAATHFQLLRANEDRAKKQELLDIATKEIEKLQENERALKNFHKDQYTSILLKCNEDKLLYMQLLRGAGDIRASDASQDADPRAADSADEPLAGAEAPFKRSESVPVMGKSHPRRSVDVNDVCIIQSQNELLRERLAILESRGTPPNSTEPNSPKACDIESLSLIPPYQCITAGQVVDTSQNVDSESSESDIEDSRYEPPKTYRKSVYTRTGADAEPAKDLKFERVSPPSRPLPSNVSFLGQLRNSVVIGLKGELQMWSSCDMEVGPVFTWRSLHTEPGFYVQHVCDMIGAIGSVCVSHGPDVMLMDPRQSTGHITVLDTTLERTAAGSICHSLCAVRGEYVAAGLRNGTIVLFDPRAPATPLCSVPSLQDDDHSTALNWLSPFCVGAWADRLDPLSLLQGLVTASSLGVVKLWDEGWTTLPSSHNLGRPTALCTVQQPTVVTDGRPKTAPVPHQSVPLRNSQSAELDEKRASLFSERGTNMMTYVCSARDDCLRAWVWSRRDAAPKLLSALPVDLCLQSPRSLSSAAMCGNEIEPASSLASSASHRRHLTCLSAVEAGEWVFAGDSLGRLRVFWSDNSQIISEQKLDWPEEAWHPGAVSCLTHIPTAAGFTVLTASENLLRYTDLALGA